MYGLSFQAVMDPTDCLNFSYSKLINYELETEGVTLVNLRIRIVNISKAESF